MRPPEQATEIARAELVPTLQALSELANEEGMRDQATFFRRIESALENAREEEDLADPFIELSTSAFRGFSFSPAGALLLDRVLELAHRLSTTLSASTDDEH
jgi:hypothetical protein